MLRQIVGLLRRACSETPAPSDSAWSERFLFDYSMGRYTEIDGLIARTRQSAQSLLTWQTALFLGAAGLASKGGLIQFWTHDCWVGSAAVASVAALGVSLVFSARVAFWTEAANVPVDPAALLTDVCESSIDKRALCRNLGQVYSDSKKFLKRLQKTLRMSLLLTAFGLAVFVVLLSLLSIFYPSLVAKMLSSK